MELPLEPTQLAQVVKRKPVAAKVLGFWTILGAGLGFGGLLLSIQAIQRGRLSRLFRYPARLSGTWALGEVARIVLLLVFVASLLPFVRLLLLALGPTWATDDHVWGLTAMFVLEGFLVLLLWGFAQAKASSLIRLMGLSWSRGLRAIRHGLVSYVTMFPWIVGLLWLTAWLCQAFGFEPPVEPIHELLFAEQRPLIVALTVLLACVVGPIAEELFFRGVVFAALRKRTARLLAILISSALFAGVHTNVVGFLPILLLGGVLAYVYERTGSLWGSIAVHILHNSFLVGTGLTLKELLWRG